MEEARSFSKISVVGAGLIGSSILRAVRRFDIARELAVCDADSYVRDRVHALGLADQVTDNLADLSDSELIVVCVPSHAVPKLVIMLSETVSERTVITDVASVKSVIFRQVFDKVRDDFPYVPGHPMVGGEKSGPDAGVEMLFQGGTCLLTPHSETPQWAVHTVSSFWTAMGARTECMAPEVHDRLVALSSHLPHLIAFALMEVVGREFGGVASPTSFIGGGLREQIRLGLSNTVVWNDIFNLNAGPLLDRLEMLEACLREWRNAIVAGEDGKLDQRLMLARDAAQRLSSDGLADQSGRGG